MNTIKNLKNDQLISFSNLLRILGIVTQKRAFAGPLKVVLDITNQCDMDCAMCLYHSPYLLNKELLIKELSLKKFSLLIKDLKNLKVKTIVLGGEGEPLMHPSIVAFIKIARDNLLEVELITNAYYLDKEKINFFVEIGVKKIIVSLHAADEITFKKVRPLKKEKDFKKILENLFLFTAIKKNNAFPLLFITNVISNLNYYTIPKMIKLAQQLKANKILFKPLLSDPNLNKNLTIPDQEINKLIKDLKIISSETMVPHNIFNYINTLNNNREKKDASQTKKIRICHIPWSHSAIDIAGGILGCVYSQEVSFRENIYESSYLGNIYESSFREIWYGEKYNLFRKKTFCPPHCLGKAVYPLLFG